MNREDYKYYKEIERLGLQIECPYIIDEEFELVAFRFTYNAEIDETDFIPQALKPNCPRRSYHDEISECNDYGISLFDDYIKAREVYKNFAPIVKLKLGYKCLASSSVNNKDGMRTPTNNSGHFNLHELKDVRLELKFNHIEYL